jgi:hypothetical protein
MEIQIINIITNFVLNIFKSTITKIQDSSVGIKTGFGAGRPGSWDSISDRDKKYFSSP